MRRKFYKELWRLRFEKMLRLEREAMNEYEALLKECEKTHKDHPVADHLKRLAEEERKHASLVEELQRILEAQKP